MLSNAKINLYLHVTGKMHSGFHSLESLLIPIGICDSINIALCEEKMITITIKGEYAHLINESDNLILKAVDAICKYANIKSPGLNISLHKNIPVGAGLGGGSSDAATTLKIMNKLLGLNYSNDVLEKIGSTFGADIPFFIENRPALIKGVGDIETLVDIPELPILLIYPNIELSTVDVFKHAPFEFSEQMPIVNTHHDRMDFISYLGLCKNELESNAIELVPQIKEILEVLNKQPGCSIARMSGSGSTCFGVFKSNFELQTAFSQISQQYPQWWVKTV